MALTPFHIHPMLLLVLPIWKGKCLCWNLLFHRLEMLPLEHLFLVALLPWLGLLSVETVLNLAVSLSLSLLLVSFSISRSIWSLVPELISICRALISSPISCFPDVIRYVSFTFLNRILAFLNLNRFVVYKDRNSSYPLTTCRISRSSLRFWLVSFETLPSLSLNLLKTSLYPRNYSSENPPISLVLGLSFPLCHPLLTSSFVSPLRTLSLTPLLECSISPFELIVLRSCGWILGLMSWSHPELSIRP